MSKAERLNWTIAIVGLIASLISIFAFLTGTGSLPSLVRRPKPATVVKVMPVRKSPSAGEVVTAPIKNGIDYIGGRLKIRRHSPPAPQEKQ